MPTTRRMPGVRFAAVSMALTLLALACTGGGRPKPTPSSSAAATLRGGTLRVGWTSFGESLDTGLNSFDPVFWELSRCCLLRTLLSYNGQSTKGGGTTLRPDLAASLPEISADGLTWTFHLKQGIHYAPPLRSVEITAGDFIRAFERTATGSPTTFEASAPLFQAGGPEGLRMNEVLAGWEDYANGKAGSISGLEAPDPYTLRLHLIHAAGDLGYRLAYPALAPIPPNPGHPDAKLGVAEGHEGDYGFFLVASGPYMFAGSEKMDFSAPATSQAPPAGIGRDTITLVRNPSWNAASDDLRAAYPDRIVLVGFDPQAASEAIERGEVDVLADFDPSPPDVVERYRTTPELSSRIFFTPKDQALALIINVAVPPLDDLHVRRAVSFAIDRRASLAAFQKERGEPATVATHVLPDSMENNILLDYNPYGPGNSGNLQEAKKEMVASSYDRNHDGVCESSECKGIVFLVRKSRPERLEIAKIVRRDLRPLGIDVRLRVLDDDVFFPTFHDPASHTALNLLESSKDYPSGSNLIPNSLGSGGLCPGVCGNLNLVGAAPEYLRKYHYGVTNVPTLDPRIQACEPLAFEAAVRCWTELDQYVTEQVAPEVPLVQQLIPTLVSTRVAALSFDQAGENIPVPAFDRIALKRSARVEQSVLPTPSSIPSQVPAIPDGTYEVTVTTEDELRAGADPNDVEGLQENAGTFRVSIAGGRWRYVQSSDQHIFNPVESGVYYGSGDTVTFVAQLPPQNALVITLRWSLEGTALRFSVENVDIKDALPSVKSLFEAHPWVNVG